MPLALNEVIKDRKWILELDWKALQTPDARWCVLSFSVCSCRSATHKEQHKFMAELYKHLYLTVLSTFERNSVNISDKQTSLTVVCNPLSFTWGWGCRNPLLWEGLRYQHHQQLPSQTITIIVSHQNVQNSPNSPWKVVTDSHAEQRSEEFSLHA